MLYYRQKKDQRKDRKGMEHFNQEQKQAIRHVKGPMLVLAGPGSGKTTVIIHRVRYLIEQAKIHPEHVLVLTYTKAAAQEMKQRFLHLKVEGGQKVSFGTFHSVFFRILRQAYGYHIEQIISEEEKWNAMRSIIKQIEVDANDEDEYIRMFLSELSYMKNELQGVKEYHPNYFQKQEFQVLYQKYEGYKARQNKIDFDDMLVHCYELLSSDKRVREHWQKRYPYILIDEFQDINKVQYECICLLAQPEENIFVVGDDDQSIYCFRGARPDFLFDFPKQFKDTQKIILRINYRSTNKIVRLSEKIIRHNDKRYQKEMEGIGEEGQKIRFFSEMDATAEADNIAQKILKLQQQGVALDEIAIIYRTNLQGNLYARMLGQRGISYIMKDQSVNIYDHWIAKDIMAYLYLALGQKERKGEDVAVRRIINKPTRYISKELMKEAEAMPYPLLQSFFSCSSLSSWKEDSLRQLQNDLKTLSSLEPYEGIGFIRRTIGYDRYLEDYGKYRKASISGFFEIADEIAETAKGITNIKEYLEQMKKLGKETVERERNRQVENKKGVILTTMHSAKGLEFEVVFLPSLIEGVVPHEKSQSPQEMEEERRLFYVGATRAKERLYLSEMKKRYEKPTKRSRFLKELGLK